MIPICQHIHITRDILESNCCKAIPEISYRTQYKAQAGLTGWEPTSVLVLSGGIPERKQIPAPSNRLGRLCI